MYFVRLTPSSPGIMTSNTIISKSKPDRIFRACIASRAALTKNPLRNKNCFSSDLMRSSSSTIRRWAFIIPSPHYRVISNRRASSLGPSLPLTLDETQKRHPPPHRDRHCAFARVGRLTILVPRIVPFQSNTNVVHDDPFDQPALRPIHLRSG